MRGIFSLAGLLVIAGLCMWWFSRVDIPAAKQGEDITKQAQQISGRDTDGTPISQTMTLDPQSANGKLTGVLVEKIDAGGAMQQYYGLQPGDLIVEVGSMAMPDMNNNGDLAVSLVQQAYQQQQKLVVMRNGQRIDLPSASGSAAAQPVGAGGSGADQQLNNVRIPTH